MATKIAQEHKASLKYDLKRITKAKELLVQLTRDNVARVESMIRNDSDYSNSANELSESSSAFWLNKLSAVILDGKIVSDKEYVNIVSQSVSAIDRENSTHLNADGVGREELTQRILQLKKSDLLRFLKQPQRDGYKLVEILAAPTHPVEAKMKSRRNPSFASKFCHYACMYIFRDLEEQDNFSIFDSVVCKHMPKYAKHYNIPIPSDYRESYAAYISTIDKIIIASGDEISRNGFDHLLWYFHKAR
jgi:hypothetical protein